ncbi:hypothetical protein [Leifsonia shinshuensis]|uniref:hypothetical protein n=1 Tax=Leifsonia TaxID=110932 RepID=UPI002859576F|nr:hypothetical protein [Leifsonia shinshuensis]MDR6970222.1 hypothetical protein [Leifsonia shinshuensis]
MPGWYVHMEVAHQTAERLRAGQVPPGWGVDSAEAQRVGELCHTWRNYLALGALGPDLFYMLPDFAGTKGVVIRQVIQWVIDVWDVVDEEFVAKWEKWIDPISTNNSQLASQLTGGLSAQLGQIVDELTSAVMTAFKGLLATMGDWFGVLTSGAPQGYGNADFYWADTFHYRRTYQFAHVLYRQASDALAAATTDDERHDAEARVAFAVGWMTHCGTDVTGHAFTNAKTGGPYRDHWQRHHLVESHIDSQNYDAGNSGPLYGEFGLSALHFRVAFVHRGDAPYAGRADGPRFDYFTGFPAYDTSQGPNGAAHRRAHFDQDTEGLPDHLVQALTDAMALVHPDGPRILSQDPPYSETDAQGHPDGRPNADAMAQMWTIVYGYLKITCKDGLSPQAPEPPDVFTDHSFPTPPGGGGSGVSDSNGADVDDDDSFTLLDLLLALFAWAVYLAQVALWLATILPGLILDPLTFPAREALYYGLVVPLWNLYLLARRALVMSGFLMPKPDEIDGGLVTLGAASGSFSIASALDDPTGVGVQAMVITEPSGRLHSGASFGIDRGYPRNIVRDDPDDVSDIDITSALGLTHRLPYAGDSTEFKPSEWVAPWRYPLVNQAGDGVPREDAATHVGPYLVMQDSRLLLSALAGSDEARQRLSDAGSPGKTFSELEDLLPQDKHLGGPIDYSTYLVTIMAGEPGDEFPQSDFNLDSDRGYAWHCWDFDRHGLGRDAAHPTRGEWEYATDTTGFAYTQPCTPPQFLHPDTDAPPFVAGDPPAETRLYDPTRDLAVHYLTRDVVPPPGPQTPDACLPSKPHEPFTDHEWRRWLREG